MAEYRIRPRRGANRAREATSVYGTGEATPRTVFPVFMAERGRLVLPAEVRERLRIQPGDRLALIVDPDGTIRLQTRTVAIQNLRGSFKHLTTPGRLASDELIAERRREAAKEERESREFARKFRRWQRKKRR